jgi:methenyltetrahydrofolate cyclohydrolase
MTQLAAAPFAELLERVAAKSPTPGGGAVAGAVAALAAALAQMVVAYSLGKKNLAAHQPALEQAVRALTIARGVLLELAEEDAEAYGLVNELQKLPEGDPRRAADLPAAIRASIQVPMAMIAACADVLRLCDSLAPMTNRMLHSDLAIAAILAEGAARASLWNVRVNAALLHEAGARTLLLEQAQASLAEAARLRERVENACTS